MKRDGAVWMVVYVAHGVRQAENIASLLSAEGFLVRRRRMGGGEPAADQAFELMVLRAEAVEARRFLIDNNL